MPKKLSSRQEYEERNLADQEFSVTRPNEIWVSDITYFKIKGYAVYFSMLLSTYFPEKVVGYQVSRKCSTHLVTATFKDAFRARSNPTDLTFHSDRGGQYTSDTFLSCFSRAASSNLFSRSGRPCDECGSRDILCFIKREEAYQRITHLEA